MQATPYIYNDDENGPKRRVLRRLGHRYISFLHFFFLKSIFTCFYYSPFVFLVISHPLHYDDQMRRTNRYGRSRKDSYVTAGYVFPFFFVFFFSFHVFSCRPHLTPTMTTKTGPNDARRVVWAIGTFFFFMFFKKIYIYVFFYYSLFVYLVISHPLHLRRRPNWAHKPLWKDFYAGQTAP